MLSTLFGSRQQDAAAARDVATATATRELATARHESGVLLDSLGSILQLYGRHAFDVGPMTAGDVRSLVTDWALHATMGAARPGHEDEDRNGIGLLERDWKGLVKAFAQLRRDERQAVVTSHADLRAVVDAFVSAVHGMAVDEDDAERATRQILDRVKQATVAYDTEVLKREALVAVDAINVLMRSRRERQRERFASLGQEVRNLGAELAVAKNESLVDPLTGLSNRKAFDAELLRSIELHALLRTPVCLMLVDVDYFKTVNDVHGHPAGDAVLKQLARAHARTFLRRSDLVARFGGDEFAIILGDTPSIAGEKLAERLRQAAETLHHAVPGMEKAPTLSIGIAELVLGDDCASWVARADQALYAAKNAGRDRVWLAEADTAAVAA